MLLVVCCAGGFSWQWPACAILYFNLLNVSIWNEKMLLIYATSKVLQKHLHWFKMLPQIADYLRYVRCKWGGRWWLVRRLGDFCFRHSIVTHCNALQRRGRSGWRATSWRLPPPSVSSSRFSLQSMREERSMCIVQHLCDLQCPALVSLWTPWGFEREWGRTRQGAEKDEFNTQVKRIASNINITWTYGRSSKICASAQYHVMFPPGVATLDWRRELFLSWETKASSGKILWSSQYFPFSVCWKHGMFSTKIFRCRRCDRDVANLTGGSDVEDVNSGDEEEVSWSRGQ